MNIEKSGFFKTVKTALGMGLMAGLPLNADALPKIPDVPGNEGNKTTLDMSVPAAGPAFDFANEDAPPELEGGDGSDRTPEKDLTARSEGGPLQPVLPYGEHTLEEIKDSVLNGTSQKASEMHRLMSQNIEKLLKQNGYIFEGDTTLRWAFQYISSREVHLKKGTYYNSGWNPRTKQIEVFPGDDWEGFAYVFSWTDPRGKTLETILVKQNCANALDEIEENNGNINNGENTSEQGPTGVYSRGNRVSDISDNFQIDRRFLDQFGKEHIAKKWRIQWYKPRIGPAFPSGWVETANGDHYDINPFTDPSGCLPQGTPLVNF